MMSGTRKLTLPLLTTATWPSRQPRLWLPWRTIITLLMNLIAILKSLPALIPTAMTITATHRNLLRNRSHVPSQQYPLWKENSMDSTEGLTWADWSVTCTTNTMEEWVSYSKKCLEQTLNSGLRNIFTSGNLHHYVGKMIDDGIHTFRHVHPETGEITGAVKGNEKFNMGGKGNNLSNVGKVVLDNMLSGKSKRKVSLGQRKKKGLGDR